MLVNKLGLVLRDKRYICADNNLKNKEENLQGLLLDKPVLYFGDSEVDYLVSKNNGFDFVFVYGASNIIDWRSKMKEWRVIKSISDFSNES